MNEIYAIGNNMSGKLSIDYDYPDRDGNHWPWVDEFTQIEQPKDKIIKLISKGVRSMEHTFIYTVDNKLFVSGDARLYGGGCDCNDD